MNRTINIYCDESCHLQRDGQRAMVLGAIGCFASKAAEHHRAIAELKARHGLSRYFEIKWGRVGPGKLDFYLDLVRYFFDCPTMAFRAWIVPDKSILVHGPHGQSHDEWYYKMYFYLLRNLIRHGYKHRVYVDIKDTRGADKVRELRKVLSNANYDFSQDLIEWIQILHSHDVGMMQLADLLIGAISYHARGLHESPAKEAVVQMIKDRSGLSLDKNTLPSERKLNICIWKPVNGDMENA